MSSGGVFLQGLQYFGAAELGQEHVENDEVGEIGDGLRNGLFAICSANDTVAGFHESTLGGDTEKLAVLDEKNGFHGARGFTGGLSAGLGGT